MTNLHDFYEGILFFMIHIKPGPFLKFLCIMHSFDALFSYQLRGSRALAGPGVACATLLCFGCLFNDHLLAMNYPYTFLKIWDRKREGE